MKKRKILFWLGKIIIMLAFIGSEDPPNLSFYVIFAFALGVIFIWLSGKKVLVKVLWIVLPVILWFPVAKLRNVVANYYFECTQVRYKVEFPFHFNGYFAIVEDSPCGQKNNRKNYHEAINVPNSGILLYPKELEYSFYYAEFYMSDSLKKSRHKLDFYHSFNQIDSLKSNRIYVTELADGNRTIYLPERYDYRYSLYFVGDYRKNKSKDEEIFLTQVQNEVRKCIGEE